MTSGMSENEIARRVGSSQASINRMKLGKQSRPAFDVVDRLRELHRERLPHLYPNIESHAAASEVT